MQKNKVQMDVRDQQEEQISKQTDWSTETHASQGNSEASQIGCMELICTHSEYNI